AGSPGTAVLPTCSIGPTSHGARTRASRARSVENSEGHAGLYGSICTGASIRDRFWCCLTTELSGRPRPPLRAAEHAIYCEDGARSMDRGTTFRVQPQPFRLHRLARIEHQTLRKRSFAQNRSLVGLLSNDPVERPATVTVPRKDAAHIAPRSAPTCC